MTSEFISTPNDANNNLASNNGSTNNETKIKKLVYFYTFFASFFISTFGSISANQLLLVLMAFFLYRCQKETDPQTLFKEAFTKNKILTSIFLLWAAFSFISLVSSPYLAVLDAWFILPTRFLHSAVLIIFSYCFWQSLNNYKININLLLLLIPLGALFTGLNFAFAILLNPDMMETPYTWFNHPPFYLHIRQAGFHCSAAIGVLLAFTFSTQHSSKKKALFWCLLCFMWSYLFWTGGRASSIASILTLFLFYLILLYFKKANTKILILSISSLLLGLVISELASVFPWNGVWSSVERTSAASSADAVSSGRIMIWQRCWELLQGNLLLGTGPESYWYYRYPDGGMLVGSQPHNVIIQFLIDWGLVGLVLAATFLLVLAMKGLSTFIHNSNGELFDAKLASCLITFSYSVTALADGTFYHAQAVFFLVLAFNIWLLPAHNGKENA